MADQTRPRSPRGHDVSVAYSEVVVAGDEIDPTEWEAWTEEDEDRTHYYVKGPCPGCHADVQGHALDSAIGPTQAQGSRGRQGARKQAESAPIEVPVACTCGFSHGNDAAKSCGRRWVLEITREDT